MSLFFLKMMLFWRLLHIDIRTDSESPECVLQNKLEILDKSAEYSLCDSQVSDSYAILLTDFEEERHRWKTSGYARRRGEHDSGADSSSRSDSHGLHLRHHVARERTGNDVDAQVHLQVSRWTFRVIYLPSFLWDSLCTRHQIGDDFPVCAYFCALMHLQIGHRPVHQKKCANTLGYERSWFLQFWRWDDWCLGYWVGLTFQTAAQHWKIGLAWIRDKPKNKNAVHLEIKEKVFYFRRHHWPFWNCTSFNFSLLSLQHTSSLTTLWMSTLMTNITTKSTSSCNFSWTQCTKVPGETLVLLAAQNICVDSLPIFSTPNRKENKQKPFQSVNLCHILKTFVLRAVHGINVKIRPPTKYPTPYGGRLEWTCPGGNKIIAHLKDKGKIRHKKRWSQVSSRMILFPGQSP